MQIVQIITNNILFIFNYLIIVEIALAVLVVFILFVFKKNKKANFFLTFFVIIRSASFIPFFCGVNDLITFGYFSSFIIMPADSLIGVFLYYYTLFMTGRVEKLNKKDIIHFSLYIVLMIINILVNIYQLLVPNTPSVVLYTLILGTVIFGTVNCIIYTILSLIKIKKYSKDIKNYTSDIGTIDMTWVNKIIYFSILSIFIFLIGYSIATAEPFFYIFGKILLMSFASFDVIVLIIILFILVFYIINQPELSEENQEMYSILNNLNIKNSNNITEHRYEKVHLDIHKQETYLKLLNEYMEKNKPYLNERITIKELSEGLNLPYHHLSIVINNLLKKNFYDFINDYRIREVLNILNESRSDAVNILTISFKCGFNSKSTFNRVFKNKTGTTPSRFKKAQGKSDSM
jgi:AraC-like DNA-binding protein